MIPFDLERAKAGEPCVTRCGLKARFLHELKNRPKDKYCFIVTHEDNEESFLEDLK